MPESVGILQQVLRITPEPFVYVDEYRVHALMTARPVEYLTWLRRGLEQIARGEARLELPPKQVFHDPADDADFRVMPCVVRNGSDVCKTVKIIGTNTLQKRIPNQITVGKAFVIDPAENFVSHIFEACLLSSARTGACAALATELLSTKQGRLTVIGAGRVGYYAAFYAAALGQVHAISIADRNRGQAERTATLLGRQLPGVRVQAGPLATLPDADVVILATTSSEAFCHPPAWGAGLVVSLGADTDNQRELAPEWAASADVYVDTRDSARFGDLAAWQKAGLISADQLIDLFDALRSGHLPAAARPRIFVSTGSALFDNLSIGYLLDKIATAPR